MTCAPSIKADPFASELSNPRTVGRAGVGLVSEDSALSMFTNPAAMSRRPRAQLTLSMRGGNAKTTVESERAQQMRVVTDQRGPQASFDLGYTYGLGRLGVIAIAIAKTGERYRTYPSPLFNQPPDQVNRLYPSRYAGLSSRVKSRAIALGGGAANVRFTCDWGVIVSYPLPT